MKLQYNLVSEQEQTDHQIKTKTKTKADKPKSKCLANKMIKQYHTPQQLLPNQCSSRIVQKIDAPISLVWSVVRCFDKPQLYKQFVKSCIMSSGDGTTVGSVRELVLVSGLPAERSTERLDRLDDDCHVMMVSIIGGDHKLTNYQSTMTLHQEEEEDEDEDDDNDDGESNTTTSTNKNNNNNKTVLIESYIVDIPEDSCSGDTCCFADTIIGYNLSSLAKMAEKMMACNIHEVF